MAVLLLAEGRGRRQHLLCKVQSLLGNLRSLVVLIALSSISVTVWMLFCLPGSALHLCVRSNSTDCFRKCTGQLFESALKLLLKSGEGSYSPWFQVFPIVGREFVFWIEYVLVTVIIDMPLIKVQLFLVCFLLMFQFCSYVWLCMFKM